MNCLTDAFFDVAVSTAKELDAYLKKNGKTVGPLHGLPISLKDNFNIIGRDSCVGFTSLVGQPATYDTTLVELLRKAGAVFYCKTNIPTAMMMAESVNNVFGRAVNPLNRKTSSGGSSGGESALIAFGASPLGVGTDIGGSLRIPAACTGIFTLRPSAGRSPIQRSRPGLAGQEAVMSVNGPMTPHFESLELFMKTVVGMEPWLEDPKCLPIPWRTVEPKAKLKLGVIWDDGIVRPTPPVRRALKETVDKLKAAGFDIVDWDPVLHKEICQVLTKFFVADGGITVRKMLEPTDEPFQENMSHYRNATELGTNALWQLHLRRSELLKAYLDQWNSIEGLDGLVGPVTPHAAPANGKFGRHVGYTGVYNVLDYPATSFPSGVYADKELDMPNKEEPFGEVDADIQKECKCPKDCYQCRLIELYRQTRACAWPSSVLAADRKAARRREGSYDDWKRVEGHRTIGAAVGSHLGQCPIFHNDLSF